MLEQPKLLVLEDGSGTYSPDGYSSEAALTVIQTILTPILHPRPTWHADVPMLRVVTALLPFRAVEPLLLNQ